MTSSTSPFSFDGSELSFTSDDEDYLGIYEFPSLNLKVTVVNDDEDWTAEYDDLIDSFDSYRADDIADSRSLNIETQTVWLKDGISSGLSSFSSKS